MIDNRKSRICFVVCGVIAGWYANLVQAQPTTVNFQNGFGGYSGQIDRLISDAGNGTDATTDGSTVARYFLDGFAPDGTDTNTLPDSRDDQMLIRFDNLIGAGAGQIPANATILDAKLTLTTSLAGNAQTNGPYGVSGLTAAFDQTTTYFGSFSSTTDWGSRGAWWQDGSATRPVGGYGFQTPGSVDSANVTSLVQAWVDGSMPNHGMVVQAGLADAFGGVDNTSDGWSVQVSGYPIADGRPHLSVTYTTETVQRTTFQRGDANGYASDTMVRVLSGPNVLNADPLDGEMTQDGLTLGEDFLDGPLFDDPAGNSGSADDLALIRFGDVFGAGPNQAPSDVPVAKAWIVLTTGDDLGTDGDGNARTPGPYAAYPVLRAWDVNTLHSDFGSVAGLQVSDGDLSPATSMLDGFIRGAEVWFDVTSYLEGVRNGATDNGVAIQAAGTADGWEIHFNGSADANARPKLVVYSGDVGIVPPGLTGDFNDDGVVDAADYVFWRDFLSSQAAGYTDFFNNFGNDGGGGPLGAGSDASVPEPASMLLLLAGVGALAAARRRQD